MPKQKTPPSKEQLLEYFKNLPFEFKSWFVQEATADLKTEANTMVSKGKEADDVLKSLNGGGK